MPVAIRAADDKTALKSEPQTPRDAGSTSRIDPLGETPTPTCPNQTSRSSKQEPDIPSIQPKTESKADAPRRRTRLVVEIPVRRKRPRPRHSPPPHSHLPSPSPEESSASSESFVPSESDSESDSSEPDVDPEPPKKRKRLTKPKPARSSGTRNSNDKDKCKGQGRGRGKAPPRATASSRASRYTQTGDYNRKSDWQRYEITQLHGEIRCIFCPPVHSGLKPRGRIHRLPDAATRHLREFCLHFESSRVYREMCREDAQLSKKEIVKKLVKRHEKIAVAQVHCRMNEDYKRGCEAVGVTPMWVENRLGRHAELYKIEDCECCPLPKWSEYISKRGLASRKRARERSPVREEPDPESSEDKENEEGGGADVQQSIAKENGTVKGEQAQAAINTKQEVKEEPLADLELRRVKKQEDHTGSLLDNSSGLRKRKKRRISSRRGVHNVNNEEEEEVGMMLEGRLDMIIG